MRAVMPPNARGNPKLRRGVHDVAVETTATAARSQGACDDHERGDCGDSPATDSPPRDHGRREESALPLTTPTSVHIPTNAFTTAPARARPVATRTMGAAAMRNAKHDIWRIEDQSRGQVRVVHQRGSWVPEQHGEERARHTEGAEKYIRSNDPIVDFLLIAGAREEVQQAAGMPPEEQGCGDRVDKRQLLIRPHIGLRDEPRHCD